MSAECKKLRGPNDTGPDCGCRGDSCALGRDAANVRRLLDDVQKGGDVRIQTVNQADGPYCTVAGLGVHAGGYRTVDEAIAAWLDARDYETLQVKLDTEETQRSV